MIIALIVGVMLFAVAGILLYALILAGESIAWIFAAIVAYFVTVVLCELIRSKRDDNNE